MWVLEIMSPKTDALPYSPIAVILLFMAWGTNAVRQPPNDGMGERTGQSHMP